MGRLKGSKNKTSTSKPLSPTLALSPKDKDHFLANIVMDLISEGEKKGVPLLSTLKVKYGLPT